MTMPNAASGTVPLVTPVSSVAHCPILVATDGTATSAPALLAARLLAERLGAPIRVVSVVPPERVVLPTPDGISMPGLPVGELVASRRDRVRDQMHRAIGASTAWPLDVRAGVVSAEVADVARVTRAQLVVTGLVHHGRVDRLLRGETPLAILDEAGVPLLAVPPGAEHHPRTVLVAVDTTDACVDAAAFVRPLVVDASVVHLVHVQSQLNIAPPLMAPGADRAYHEAVRRAFTRVAAALELPPSVRVETSVLFGRVARELLDFADSAGVEMIVAGHRRRPLVERFISRGTAARLFHGATSWLLMVPEDPTHRVRLVAAYETETNAWLRDRGVWPVFVKQFTARNLGRVAELEVHDHLGAQTVVRGYPFLGIDYEREGPAVDVVLGDSAGTERHLRHTVRHATVIEVHRAPDGRDEALRVGDRFGQVLLTFRA